VVDLDTFASQKREESSRECYVLKEEQLAIYSQTVVRQFPYVRRSYDIDTTPFAIHEARCTYD